MATTNYAKADLVATKLNNTYIQTEGFRGVKVECQRDCGTYYVVVFVEAYAKVTIPPSIDHVVIEKRTVSRRNLPNR